MNAPFQSPGAGEIELKRVKRIDDARRDAPLRPACPSLFCIKVGSGNEAMITKVL